MVMAMAIYNNSDTNRTHKAVIKLKSINPPTHLVLYFQIPSWIRFLRFQLQPPVNPLQLFLPQPLLTFLVPFFCHLHFLRLEEKRMGKEWYWGGSKSRRGAERLDCISSNATATATTTSGCMSAVFQFFHVHHFQFPLNHRHPSAAAASFDPINSSLPEDDGSILKGLEAPRNSLELEEPEPPLSSSSSTVLKEEENFNIPMGIQIKTRTSCSSSETITSSSSPGGVKTPNLVARLMGLDLLPNDHQAHSPSSSSSCHETPNFSSKYRPAAHGKLISHRHSVHVDSAIRSLPETPRISYARRSDVDHYRHRLSLQINKENVNNNSYSNAGRGGGEGDEFSRISYSRRKELKLDDESRSPSQYARQIVKQVKESVSRRVGHDITNTLTRNRGGSGAEHARERDDLVNQMKKVNNKRSSSRVFNKLAVVDHQSTSPENHSTPSCSPRLSRFLEPKQRTPTSPTTNGDKISPQHQPRKCSCEAHQAQAANVIDQSQHIKVLPSSSLKSKLQPVLEQEHEQDRHQVLQHMFNDQRPTKKCKKAAETRLKKPPQTTDVIRNKQEETFVRNSAAMNRAISPDKKCKQTPLSNNLPKFSPKQVLAAQSSRQSSQLSSDTWQTYQQEAPVAQCNSSNDIKETTRPNNAAAATGEDADANAKGDAEYEYVTRILNQTGINRDSHVSFTKWLSSSNPLDPRIFHHLENNTMINPPFGHHHQMSHHCNRKLVFELVDEILAGILKPLIKMKPWVVVNSNTGRGGDHRNRMQGSELIDALCKQIRSYPRADCQVLEDIDGLIEKDLPPRMELQKGIAFEEEGEGVVLGIENDILDTLVHETAAEFRQTLRW